MKRFTFFIIFILVSITIDLKGQENQNSEKIHVIPISGKYEYVYNDSIIGNDKQLFYFLLNSDRENVIIHAKKYKRRSILSEILLGIGTSSAIIWVINEAGNAEFHSAEPADKLWYNVLVITTITTSSVGAFINLSAKKQLKLGIEEFNKE
jgi:ketopantoate reductase